MMGWYYKCLTIYKWIEYHFSEIQCGWEMHDELGRESRRVGILCSKLCVPNWFIQRLNLFMLFVQMKHYSFGKSCHINTRCQQATANWKESKAFPANIRWNMQYRLRVVTVNEYRFVDVFSGGGGGTKTSKAAAWMFCSQFFHVKTQNVIITNCTQNQY